MAETITLPLHKGLTASGATTWLLVTTDGHIVLDAPQVANASGQSDTVTNLDIPKQQVTLKLLRGWFNGTPILYVRTDASVTLVSALEASTYAANLSTAPGLGSDASTSARSAIVPVINGALTGPNRQGLESAVLSGKDPLNITQSFPGESDYTPVWDLHPVVWTPAAIKDGKRVELTSTAQVTKDFKAGLLTSAGKGPANSSLGGLRAIGFISICSTVASSNHTDAGSRAEFSRAAPNRHQPAVKSESASGVCGDERASTT
jgi:hypothetical protein